MPSFNGHLMDNLIGKTVKFDVQPYERGTGTITRMVPRMIKTLDHCPSRGRMAVEYEVFDLTIEVTEGSRTGALLGGVAVQGTVRDQAGQVTHISGVRAGQLRDAYVKGETIVIARCG